MTASLSWTATLPDPGIRADVLTTCVNDSLSQTAATQILTDVANRGAVTAAELGSLQTIALELGVTLSASAYVTSVWDQLVFGSPMNATWTGGSATAAALGNLAIGSTPLQQDELIGKWLQGTDLPNPDIPENLDGQGASAVYPSYKAIALPLFGLTGLPSVNDVNQGEMGDCVVCAAMIDMVVNHPNMLGSMIVNNGNGTYGVRFYLGGNADWVTVNDQMPVNSSASLVFNNAYAANSSFWADLIEKAYAEASASGLLGHPAVNSYDNINANTASIVLPAFTGRAVTVYNAASPSWSANQAIYKQAFIQDLAIGDDLLLGDQEPDGVNTTDGSGALQLIGDHEFAVIGYDSATGNFILRNPWGVAAPGSSQNFDTQFEVSIDQIAAVYGTVTVDHSGGLPLGPYTVIGALAAGQAGTLAGAAAIADSAADVAQDLDQLQALASAGQLGAITLTDGGQPTLSIRPGQLAADAAALADVTGSYSLAFSGALTVAQEQGLLASALATRVTGFTVADSAATISASLDRLQALAASGELTSITLTNLAIPTLTLTSAQLTDDAKALSDIAGAYWLNGSQLALPQAGSANVAVVEINPDPALGPAAVRFVDNQGGVVGFFGDSELNFQAFAWSGANPTSVSPLSPLAGDVATVAKMDNAAGTVAGYSTSSSDRDSAVLWPAHSTIATALPLNSGFTSGTALAINAAGDVAGSEQNGTIQSIVIWKNGVATEVGASAGAVSDTSYAINDSDGLAGSATIKTANGTYTTGAYTYQNGLVSVLPALAGDSSSGAYGINNANQVVGFSLGSSEHAVVWQNGQVATLGTLAPSDQSFAYAIDNAGIVVGYDFSVQNQKAVIWVDGVIYNLNSLIPPDSGWILQTARSDDNLDDGTVLVTGSGVLDGAADSYAAQIPVANLSPTVAAAWQGYQTGLMTSPVHITDSASDISASLDALQTLASASLLSSVTLSDSGSPILSITSAQATGDATALGDISGNFSVTQTATGSNLSITGVTGALGNTVAFSGAASQYVIAPAANDQSFTVASTGSSDSLSHIQALQFSDVMLIVAQTPGVTTVTSGNITELYAAVFGREPDVPGLAYYQNELAANPSLPLVLFAQDFLASPEYSGKAAHDYAATTAGDTQFITDCYANLLQRAPATGDAAWYEANVIAPVLAGLRPGTAAYAAADSLAHAKVICDFSASVEFLGDVQVTIAHPASSQHWLVLI